MNVLRRLASPAFRHGPTLADGSRRELQVEARDLAEAAARVIRQARADSAEVARIDRLGPG